MARKRQPRSTRGSAKTKEFSSILVSGVTSEIGLPLVRTLWDRGFGVYGFYGRSRKRAKQLEQEAAKTDARLRLERIDFLDSSTARQKIRKAIRSAPRDWQNIVSFVGLAGYPARGVWQQPFDKNQPDLFEDVYRVDTLSHVWFLQAVAPTLKNNKGSAVLMSSAAALLGDELGIPFALAKAANVALVKSAARLLAPEVRVNGVAPGALRTSWLNELTPSQRRKSRQATLLQRLGEPAEVAETVAELAVGESRFQTGQILVLDGGVAL